MLQQEERDFFETVRSLYNKEEMEILGEMLVVFTDDNSYWRLVARLFHKKLDNAYRKVPFSSTYDVTKSQGYPFGIFDLLENVPTKINDENILIRIVARWRLVIGH